MTPDAEQEQVPASREADGQQLSGWKIGFSAGISFALTLLVVGAVYWGGRAIVNGIAASRASEAALQEYRRQEIVSPEFMDKARKDAALHHALVVAFDGDKKGFTAAADRTKVADAELDAMARTTHESRIARDLHWSTHNGEFCVELNVSGPYPSKRLSDCKRETHPEDIDKALQ